MPEKPTQMKTGRIRNQAFWFTGLVVTLIEIPSCCALRCELAWGDAALRSCHELLVLVIAGVFAQHLQPHAVAHRGRLPRLAPPAGAPGSALGRRPPRLSAPSATFAGRKFMPGEPMKWPTKV